MGKLQNKISLANMEFIEKQHIFFVATAPLSRDGRVNVSPKGLDCFRVLSDNKVAYMDLLSSGNETSAHTLENGRITIMFCSFEGKPLILRLYGKGHTVLRDTEEWEKYAPLFKIYRSTRQIIIADIDMVQTSCGFGVPEYDFKRDRDAHFKWADNKSDENFAYYMEHNNSKSLDGLPTDLALKK